VIIKKKTWPDMFEKMLSGQKRFDARLSDFNVNEGDILVLEEFDPTNKTYTGRKIKKKVNFVLKTKDQKFWTDDDIRNIGLTIMSFD